MNELLMYHLVHDLIDERHADAARNRQLHEAFPGEAARWHWRGARNTRRRNADPLAAIATAASVGAAR